MSVGFAQRRGRGRHEESRTPGTKKFYLWQKALEKMIFWGVFWLVFKKKTTRCAKP